MGSLLLGQRGGLKNRSAARIVDLYDPAIVDHYDSVQGRADQSCATMCRYLLLPRSPAAFLSWNWKRSFRAALRNNKRFLPPTPNLNEIGKMQQISTDKICFYVPFCYPRL
jgi:hypothetical protein